MKHKRKSQYANYILPAISSMYRERNPSEAPEVTAEEYKHTYCSGQSYSVSRVNSLASYYMHMHTYVMRSLRLSMCTISAASI